MRIEERLRVAGVRIVPPSLIEPGSELDVTRHGGVACDCEAGRPARLVIRADGWRIPVCVVCAHAEIPYRSFPGGFPSHQREEANLAGAYRLLVGIRDAGVAMIQQRLQELPRQGAVKERFDLLLGLVKGVGTCTRDQVATWAGVGRKTANKWISLWKRGGYVKAPARKGANGLYWVTWVGGESTEWVEPSQRAKQEWTRAMTPEQVQTRAKQIVEALEDLGGSGTHRDLFEHLGSSRHSVGYWSGLAEKLGWVEIDRTSPPHIIRLAAGAREEAA